MKSDHSLAQLCAAFDVKRSGYHAWVQAGASLRARTDAALLPKIRAVFARHKGRYGSPRIQDELADQGARHGGKRIARLMKAAGLRGLCSRRFVPRIVPRRSFSGVLVQSQRDGETAWTDHGVKTDNAFVDTCVPLEANKPELRCYRRST